MVYRPRPHPRAKKSWRSNHLRMYNYKGRTLSFLLSYLKPSVLVWPESRTLTSSPGKGKREILGRDEVGGTPERRSPAQPTKPTGLPGR